MSAEKATFGTKHLKDLVKLFELNEKSRNILLSILDMLRLGVITIDSNECITFVNNAAQKMLGDHHRNLLGKNWKDLLPLDKKSREIIDNRIIHNVPEQNKIEAHLQFHDGRKYWMEIEVHDDPRDQQKKIFFLYDLTEIHDLRRLLDKKAGFHDLIGKSEPMQNVYERIQQAANVNWNVLIEGETGTGKELAARAIHYSSSRKDKPFIAVNCAGLQDTLLTSQLFGHKKGAFTGAIEDYKGFFETANQGTIFLDEIGDISVNMQTNLLRVLEEKEIVPVGSAKPVKIDVRIVAATNKDLNHEIQENRFRKDLFYRLRVIRIKMPPLTERREDIPLLINAFLKQSCTIAGISAKQLSKKAVQLLLKYHWPGNVRELKSAIEFAILHAKDAIVKTENLPPELEITPLNYLSAHQKDPDEQTRILNALDIAAGNRALAARSLNMSRATFYRRLNHYGIKPKNS